MIVTSRTRLLKTGLAVVAGSCLLAGVANAQTGGSNPASTPATDNAVRKTNTPAPSGTPTTSVPKPVAAVFGTVDLKAVLDGYDKLKSQMAEFEAAVKVKQGELAKIQTEAQDEVQKLAKLTPNGIDAKKIEDHLTELKSKLEATKENASRDFTVRQADLLAKIYAEVQDMVSRIAVYRGMTYVMQISNENPSSGDPQTVVAAMGRALIYSDPRNDITKDVVYNLNRAYKAAGGVAPRAAAAPAAGPGGASPSGN